MEFWDSKVVLTDTNIHRKMSSDEDDILKHLQHLDIGDNFMDDDDVEDSYESEDRGLKASLNGRDKRAVTNGEANADVDYPDDLSDISDLFENDAHLLNLDIGISNNGASKNKEVQMLSLDEVPYSRDLKWINTPEDGRPKPKINWTGNRFLKHVQGITSNNQGELKDLDKHYKNLDQKKRDYDLSGTSSRDRRRGRTNGNLAEAQFVPPSDPQGDGLATRGPGKLVIFDDDPKPSQRRKRPYRPRLPRGDGRVETGSVRGEREGGREGGRDGGREGWESREEQKLNRGISKERRERGQYTHKGDNDTTHSHSNRSNGTINSQSQSPRILTHGTALVPTPSRQEVLAIQTRPFSARSNGSNLNPPLKPNTNTVTPNTPLNQRSATFVPSQPAKQQQKQQQQQQQPQQYPQQHLISETNAIKLRADAPVWTPPTSVYT